MNGNVGKTDCASKGYLPQHDWSQSNLSFAPLKIFEKRACFREGDQGRTAFLRMFHYTPREATTNLSRQSKN